MKDITTTRTLEILKKVSMALKNKLKFHLHILEINLTTIKNLKFITNNN
jgi:hypothetical protein